MYRTKRAWQIGLYVYQLVPNPLARDGKRGGPSVSTLGGVHYLLPIVRWLMMIHIVRNHLFSLLPRSTYEERKHLDLLVLAEDGIKNLNELLHFSVG